MIPGSLTRIFPTSAGGCSDYNGKTRNGHLQQDLARSGADVRSVAETWDSSARKRRILENVVYCSSGESSDSDRHLKPDVAVLSSEMFRRVSTGCSD